MEESKKNIKEIGACFCLKSPYKHFIITSLEESIQKRDEEIDIIKKVEDIKKIKGMTNHRETMIGAHKLTVEELTKIRNMVLDIPSCKT